MIHSEKNEDEVKMNEKKTLTRPYRPEGSVSTYPRRAFPPNLPLYMALDVARSLTTILI